MGSVMPFADPPINVVEEEPLPKADHDKPPARAAAPKKSWDDHLFSGPVRSGGAVSISAYTFERMCMAPQQNFVTVKHSTQHKFGDAIPIALAGFLITLTPLSCDLMGWRGASRTGAANIGTYFFFGGLLQLIAGIMEWIAAKSFPSIVFSSYGAFFFSFGATLHPAFGAAAAYAPAGQPASAGLQTRGFNAGFGFFMIWMAALSFVFLICSLRTNVTFVVIFASLVGGFASLTGAYWLLADDFTGHGTTPTSLITASGACFFVTCSAGWWVFIALMLDTVDFPVALPVGDLSNVVKPRRRAEEQPEEEWTAARPN